VIGEAADAPIGSEPGAQPESPVAQTITQSVRNEGILVLSRISWAPTSAGDLRKVIGNIRLREHELKSLLTLMEAMRTWLERT